MPGFYLSYFIELNNQNGPQVPITLAKFLQSHERIFLFCHLSVSVITSANARNSQSLDFQINLNRARVAVPFNIPLFFTVFFLQTVIVIRKPAFAVVPNI